MIRTLAGLSLIALALQGCATDGPRVSAYDQAVYSCRRDTKAPGTYDISATERDTKGFPLVKAGAGGTLRGEVLLSECLAARLPAGGAAVTPPAGAAKPGKLPLPAAYPLLSGDAELWPTLTLAQQQRALLFLRDGSTIRASLRTD